MIFLLLACKTEVTDTECQHTVLSNPAVVYYGETTEQQSLMIPRESVNIECCIQAETYVCKEPEDIGVYNEFFVVTCAYDSSPIWSVVYEIITCGE